MKFDDFSRLATLWDEMGEDDLDLLAPSCGKSDMIDLMMVLHSSKSIYKSSELLTEFYETFNEDVTTCFWVLKLLFLAKQIDIKKPTFPFSSAGKGREGDTSLSYLLN